MNDFEMSDFACARCDRGDQARIERRPFPGALGDRLMAEICAACWEEWKTRQMLLINHYGLKLHDAAAREFLYKNLGIFLFKDPGIAAHLPGD